jgi:hypothetical protein
MLIGESAGLWRPAAGPFAALGARPERARPLHDLDGLGTDSPPPRTLAAGACACSVTSVALLRSGARRGAPTCARHGTPRALSAHSDPLARNPKFVRERHGSHVWRGACFSRVSAMGLSPHTNGAGMRLLLDVARQVSSARSVDELLPKVCEACVPSRPCGAWTPALGRGAKLPAAGRARARRRQRPRLPADAADRLETGEVVTLSEATFASPGGARYVRGRARRPARRLGRTSSSSI